MSERAEDIPVAFCELCSFLGLTRKREEGKIFCAGCEGIHRSLPPALQGPFEIQTDSSNGFWFKTKGCGRLRPSEIQKGVIVDTSKEEGQDELLVTMRYYDAQYRLVKAKLAPQTTLVYELLCQLSDEPALSYSQRVERYDEVCQVTEIFTTYLAGVMSLGGRVRRAKENYAVQSSQQEEYEKNARLKAKR